MTLLRECLIVAPRRILLSRKVFLRSSSSETSKLSGEDKITSILNQKFPKAEMIHVEDISGGCGAMYAVSVVSSEFKGMNILSQHRLVNDALKAEVKVMHGLRIQTAVAQENT